VLDLGSGAGLDAIIASWQVGPTGRVVSVDLNPVMCAKAQAHVATTGMQMECREGSEEVYAHLGTMRHRSDVVEYRLEQHRDVLADRLSKLGFVTTVVTTECGREDNEEPRSRKAATGSDVTSSGRGDLNPGPPAPEAGALTGLRYAPWYGER
jgi:predicted nicotinamide N-methyase